MHTFQPLPDKERVKKPSVCLIMLDKCVTDGRKAAKTSEAQTDRRKDDIYQGWNAFIGCQLSLVFSSSLVNVTSRCISADSNFGHAIATIQPIHLDGNLIITFGDFNSNLENCCTYVH